MQIILYFSLSLDCSHNQPQLISLCHWWKSAAGESLRNNLHCWGRRTHSSTSEFLGEMFKSCLQTLRHSCWWKRTFLFWYCLKKTYENTVAMGKELLITSTTWACDSAGRCEHRGYSACQCHWRDTRLHAPVKSKCWEPVEPTLIHVLCAEDICITEHTLTFTFWFPAHCHSNSLANEITALGLIKTQWLFGKLMVECSDLLKGLFRL